MIVKHCPITAAKSSIIHLVEYLVQEKTNDRVGTICIRNGQEAEITDSNDRALDAAHKMFAVQTKNTLAEGNKTYHFLFSFPTGEEPDEKTLREIEEAFCKRLGFEEHQRISVIHRDTDNLHVHVAVNKIHPTRYTMKTPYYDYFTFSRLAADIEKKYNLKSTNHEHKKKLSENKVQDMEAHRGEQSFCHFMRQNLEDLKKAQSWQEFHALLKEHGVELQRRGNGFIFKSGDGTCVKASTIDRSFSKAALEKRFGSFETLEESIGTRQEHPKKTSQKEPLGFKVDTRALYARYQREKQEAKERKAQEFQRLSREQKQRIQQIKNSAALKRQSLKVFARGRSPLMKRLAYQQISWSQQKDIQRIREDIHAKKRALPKQKSWADWLKAEALKGNEEALAALRSREISSLKRAMREASNA
ncbi:MAG: relaxase/mobilization nuclease domain-containing protein, partial [Acetobacter sp.]|nr:relaxase/mobilization nuclease domain-containing protein [Acetobacter sp.]